MTVDQQETVAHQSSIFTVLLNWIFPLEPCQISTPEEVGDDWSTILSFILLIKCRDAIGEMLTGDGGAWPKNSHRTRNVSCTTPLRYLCVNSQIIVLGTCKWQIFIFGPHIMVFSLPFVLFYTFPFGVFAWFVVVFQNRLYWRSCPRKYCFCEFHPSKIITCGRFLVWRV